MSRGFASAALSLRQSLGQSAEQPEFSSVHFKAINEYCNQFLFRCLPEELQSKLTQEEQEALQAETVKVAFVLLVRDLLQAQPELFNSTAGEWPGKWVEQFTAQLLMKMNAPVEPYAGWLSIQQADQEEDSARLVFGLSQQLGIEPETLWELHSGMVEVVLEDFFPEAISSSN